MTPLLLAAIALGAAGPSGRLVPVAPHAWAWISADDHSANGALIVGNRAALIVDPGLTPALARELLAAVRVVTKVPVRFAVLTHWHPDHAMGMMCFGPRPFALAAHRNAIRDLSTRGPAVAKALASNAQSAIDRTAFERCRIAPPDREIVGPTSFDLGGRTVIVTPPGPAHTDGDLLVWEPAERVLVSGDVFMHQASPDMGEGHPAHWAAVLDSLVTLGPVAVVAGHFGPSTPADLTRFRDYLATLIGRVDELLAAKVPPDSVPGRIRMPEFADFAQYPGFHATIKDNAAAIIREKRPSP